jgi:hypothetical protein
MPKHSSNRTDKLINTLNALREIEKTVLSFGDDETYDLLVDVRSVAFNLSRGRYKSAFGTENAISNLCENIVKYTKLLITEKSFDRKQVSDIIKLFADDAKTHFPQISNKLATYATFS